MKSLLALVVGLIVYVMPFVALPFVVFHRLRRIGAGDPSGGSRPRQPLAFIALKYALVRVALITSSVIGWRFLFSEDAFFLYTYSVCFVLFPLYALRSIFGSSVDALGPVLSYIAMGVSALVMEFLLAVFAIGLFEFPALAVAWFKRRRNRADGS